MAKIQNRISEETLRLITPLVPKLMNETVGDVFTKEEIALLEIMFFEMTGRPAGKGCGRMCATTLVLCQNYFKIYPTTEITEEVMIAEVEDYNNYSLKELREMFPSIKSTSKKDFIKQINEL